MKVLIYQINSNGKKREGNTQKLQLVPITVRNNNEPRHRKRCLHVRLKLKGIFKLHFFIVRSVVLFFTSYSFKHLGPISEIARTFLCPQSNMLKTDGMDKSNSKSIHELPEIIDLW